MAQIECIESHYIIQRDDIGNFFSSSLQSAGISSFGEVHREFFRSEPKVVDPCVDLETLFGQPRSHRLFLILTAIARYLEDVIMGNGIGLFVHSIMP